MRTQEVADWGSEREAIRLRKEAIEKYEGEYVSKNLLGDAGWEAWIAPEGKGYQVGWTLYHLTDDPVLGKFRFCNVRREQDLQTRLIDQHIRQPFADHGDLWFFCAIARYLNWWPATQEIIAQGKWPLYPHWRPEYMTAVLEARHARGEKCEGGAFMTRAESDKNAPWFSWTKRRYVCEVVLGNLWRDRDQIQGVVDGGLLSCEEVFENGGSDSRQIWEQRQPTSKEVWETLQGYTGYGPFTAYQLVVDLQHTRYLRDAPDVNTWAAAGPGTLRGLNRWLGREVKAPLAQDEALYHLMALRNQLNSGAFTAPWVKLPLDLSDILNICCEYDKYQRVKLGEGRPRALYVPGRGS